MLLGCAYISQQTRPIKLAELKSLWLNAIEYNEAHDLTGALLYNGQEFVHVIEGEEDDVKALLDRVYADERHQDHETIFLADIGSRLFGYWPLKLLNVSGADELCRVFSRRRFLSHDRRTRQQTMFSMARF